MEFGCGRWDVLTLSLILSLSCVVQVGCDASDCECAGDSDSDVDTDTDTDLDCMAGKVSCGKGEEDVFADIECVSYAKIAAGDFCCADGAGGFADVGMFP